MSPSAQVLIVGAGPTGLTAAAELARRGIACRIVEQLDTPTTTSKAVAVHARTLELFESMGIAAEAVVRGRWIHGSNLYSGGKRIAHVGFDDLDGPFPFVLSLPQSETEAILGKLLARLGVTVERSVKLASLAQADDGVTAGLVHQDGREERARASYVIGCDGAHSTTRKLLDLPFEGAPYEQGFVLGDVRIECDLPDDEAHAFFSQDGVCGLIPLPGDRRFRLVAEAPLPPPDKPAPEPTLEDLQAIVATRARPSYVVSDPRWISRFKIHRRIVPSYAKGRIFLAGDAAHIHSPVGGQGMNTGIQDAWNLAWKLALVLEKKGPPSLLESYSAERHPIAAATLTATDVATRFVTLRSPITREVRDRIGGFLISLEAVQRRIARTAAELDLSYRRSPIVREDRGSLLDATVLADRATERASVRDWIDFGTGPAAGDRAPDVVYAGEEAGAPKRVFDLLRGTSHALMLFDGGAATAAGWQNLASIAQAVRERYRDLVRSFVIVPRPAAPSALAAEHVVLDAAGRIHHRYGAGAECLYLVRPDGYVGYRSQPADRAKLLEYLATVLL